ncbi:MAG: sensor histidine kinase [Chitinophagales bacterium]
MKQKIHILLPIALSICLPLLGLITRNLSAETGFISTNFYEFWFRISLLFYVLWHLLEKTPKLFPNKKIWGILITILLWCLLVYLATEVLAVFSDNIIKSKGILRITVVTTLFLTIQYALRTQSKNINLALEKKQIEAENYKTQLQSLRSRVDPHFLFNTLNTLRIMVRNQHGEAEKFVISLSDFYRQTLQYNEKSTIELAKEIEVLEAYLFLMQSRNQAGLTIDIAIQTSVQKRFIPTLALQIVAENCFKHNTMTSMKPLHISIKNISNNHVSIRNNIQPKLTPRKSSGHGLENIRQRYKLLSIENGVEIQQTDGFFEVILKLI